MAKVMAFYNNVVKPEFLRANPICAVHADGKVKCLADQIHHVRGRLATLLIDTRFFKGVCLCGHQFIDQNRELTRECGLLCDKGDWNKAPEDEETRVIREIIKDITK